MYFWENTGISGRSGHTFGRYQVFLTETLQLNLLPCPSIPFTPFPFSPTYVGRGASKASFGVTAARHPRGPLDVLVVEDDEGCVGVGGEGGLEGVPLWGEKS